MSSLRRHAERRRLERVLHVEEGGLAFVESIDGDDLAEFRRGVEHRIADRSAAAFRAVVRASRLLPDELVANIARHGFPPLLCARLVPHLDARRATSIASRLDAPFLAEVSVHVRPDAVVDFVDGVPEELLVGVTDELVRRDELVAAGRLTGIAPTSVLPRLLAVVVDDAALARLLLLLEQGHDGVVAALPDDRLASVARHVSESGRDHHWVELAGWLSPAQAARLRAAAV